MKKYMIIEKHVEIQELDEPKVYYDVIEEFDCPNSTKAYNYMREVMDDLNGLFEGDKYFLCELKHTIFIEFNE